MIGYRILGWLWSVWPIDGWVHDAELGESKDNVFLFTTHDVEEMFLGDPLDVGVEGTGIANHTSFVCCLVHIVDCNGGSKFHSRELILSDELPVNAGDVGT